MITKLLGTIDFLAGIWIILMHYGYVSRTGITLFFAGYLIIKGLSFWGDAASYVDMVIGVYMIILTLGFQVFLTLIFAVFLLQKGFFSFVWY